MTALRTFVNEIKAEKRRHIESIRAIYARVARTGYDKTAVGQVVQIIERHGDDATAFQRASATVQEYLNELGFAPKNVSPPACAREANGVPTEIISPLKARVRALVRQHEANKSDPNSRSAA